MLLLCAAAASACAFMRLLMAHLPACTWLCRKTQGVVAAVPCPALPCDIIFLVGKTHCSVYARARACVCVCVWGGVQRNFLTQHPKPVQISPHIAPLNHERLKFPSSTCCTRTHRFWVRGTSTTHPHALTHAHTFSVFANMQVVGSYPAVLRQSNSTAQRRWWPSSQKARRRCICPCSRARPCN